jgi:peptidoglycan/xylan/chitin deacetylase (PgdA/CDA1 family)
MFLGRGYEPVTLTRGIAERAEDKVMAVTFDDACRSVFESARPVLSRLGVVATVFVPTAFPGLDTPMSWAGIEHWSRGPDAHELIPMSWELLGELHSEGWEIGSHTCTHPDLTTLGDVRLAAELDGSRRTCEERLGVPCTAIAYPYGSADLRVAQAAEAAGYTIGTVLAAVETGPHGRLLWPRLSLYQNDGRLRARVKEVAFGTQPRLWNVLASSARRFSR